MCFNLLIEAYGQKSLHKKAEFTYLELLDSRCIPTEDTYALLLKAYCMSGLLEKAEAVFCEMRKYGLPPSMILYQFIKIITNSSIYILGIHVTKSNVNLSCWSIIDFVQVQLCIILTLMDYWKEETLKKLLRFSRGWNEIAASHLPKLTHWWSTYMGRWAKSYLVLFMPLTGPIFLLKFVIFTNCEVHIRTCFCAGEQILYGLEAI